MKNSLKVNVPEPAGLHWLIEELHLRVPAPAVRSVIGGSRRTITRDAQTLEQYPRHYRPDTIPEHLRFALRYEPVDLAVYHAAFKVISEDLIERWVKGEPNGIYARRAWYLYESLTGKRLELPDLTTGRYVALLNAKTHVTGPPRSVRRQRVVDNLLGDFEHCPLVRRTERLSEWQRKDHPGQMRTLLSAVDPLLLARAVSYLYTKETKSSFAIEGETPSEHRTQRFVAALSSAATFNPTEKAAFVELHNIIVDPRYAQHDWRSEQVYVGQTLRDYSELVHYVSPKPEDVPRLMDGWMAMMARLGQSPEVDPVCQAAAVAFGFVYVHPFDDGNGRIHRFLIHHVLAKTGFTPPGMIFPVSASMVRNLAAYDRVLARFSGAVRPFIEYRLDDSGRMTVLNETRDLYRFFDATDHAEYLYGVIEDAIRTDLAEELVFLKFFDMALRRVLDIVDMPDNRASLLVRLIHQNQGRLSRAKRGLFTELTDDEVKRIEEAVNRSASQAL